MNVLKFVTICLSLILSLSINNSLLAQASENLPDKRFGLNFGAGFFNPIIEDEGVTYENAEFAPETNAGFSYFLSFDYALTENFAIGLGFNGNYATANYIRNAVVDETLVPGYLGAGAVANTHLLLNFTYMPFGDGIKPYAKLGLGYFINQAELGDVPLELTNNVEEEIFPDFKFSGFGIIPELGVRYNSFTLTAAYSLPFGELTGETVPGGYLSVGSLTSQGLQINLSYRIGLF